MCLSGLQSDKPLIADVDIICYKMLKVKPIFKIFGYDFGKQYLSPFHLMKYKIGKTYTSRLVVLEDCFDYRVYVVEDGLHTFADKDEAKQHVNDGEVLVKCMIPKGSKYFFGHFGISQSLASEKLTVIKIMDK